jgi:RND family efflux transporter MFP subunit
MKRWIKWIIAALVVGVIAVAVGRALSARKAQQQAAAAAAAAKTVSLVELAPTDVLRAQTRELALGLPVSGALRAVNSAVVKARVAGELQDLTVREGDSVKTGQVIARIDPTESQARVQQAQQQADAARAQIDIAQRQFDNNQALVNQGFISKTALETSQANLNAARASHQAAVAAADVARKALAETVLRAPIGGQVAQRLAQPGERVAVDGRIVEIVDLARMELEAALSPADSVAVRVGQSALLQVEGATQPVPARVARISPSAQAGSRGVLVYLAVEPQPGLRQGLFAQGTLGTGKVSALALPVTAVRTDKPQPYVQVVENDRIVHKTVTPGARGETGGEAMVAVGGVAENAVVLAGAVGPVREGTGVTFTQPARP